MTVNPGYTKGVNLTPRIFPIVTAESGGIFPEKGLYLEASAICKWCFNDRIIVGGRPFTQSYGENIYIFFL